MRGHAIANGTYVAAVNRIGHELPPDGDTEDRLKHLRPGQIVHAQGWLVDIRGPAGFTWNTSLRRDDTGAGACEILYVESLDVE